MTSALFFNPGAFAKDDSRAAAVKAAEIARFAAIEKSDAETTAKLLADDLEYCHSNGLCENKATYLEMMTSGKRKYVGFVPTVSGVRLFGDVAIVSGTAKVNVVTDGKPQEFSIGYTDVYVWRDKHWQMTSWRSTRFADAPAK
jgi:hypothetical protein